MMPRHPKHRGYDMSSGTGYTTTAYRTANDDWEVWNGAWRIVTSSATTCNDALWRHWNATTTATTTTETWGVWNREYQAQWIARAQYEARERHVRAETPEMAAARRVEQERRQAEIRASQAILEAAKEKAEKLLQSTLDDKQKEELRTKGHFHCKSNKGVIYRIKRGTHGNVSKLDPTGTKEVESLCIQPDNVPAQDAMLAQKLMIENDEDSFRRIANISRFCN